jgi:hypothetical protein
MFCLIHAACCASLVQVLPEKKRNAQPKLCGGIKMVRIDDA